MPRLDSTRVPRPPRLPPSSQSPGERRAGPPLLVENGPRNRRDVCLWLLEQRGAAEPQATVCAVAAVRSGRHFRHVPRFPSRP